MLGSKTEKISDTKHNLRTMNIAVYCSARKDIAPECFADARALGRWIGENGHTLVYGGLRMGLMDAVASATAAAGGKVIGVVPWHRKEMEHPDNTTDIYVTTLHERKQTMEENADAYVALDGGYGTLDEVMSALASGSFFDEPKPLILLNRNDLYTPLMQMFDTMVQRGLMFPHIRTRVTLCPTLADVVEQLGQCASE